MKEIKLKDVGETIYEHTAASGLKVYIWPYSLSEEIDLSLTVKYGSIDTEFKVGKKTYRLPSGIAHFLEHIKFNEKKDLTAHQYFYEHAAYTNAYTTYDHTSYEVTCSKDLENNLTHLLYFVLNPYFTKSLVEKEKGIITEECKMTLDDPYFVGYQTLMENLYKYDKKRYLVTGNKEDISLITIDDALAVFDNFYHPGNMFLTVTGNVNPYEVVKIVDNYFEQNPYSAYMKPKMLNKKEPDSVLNEGGSIKSNVTKEKLFIAFKIPKKYYKGYSDLNLRILFSIIMTINFGTTSEFNDSILKNDLIDDISYSTVIDKNNIVVLFESSTSYPKELLERIKDKMRNLEVDNKEFSRKIKTLIASSILGYEDAADVNSDIRMDIIKYGKIINDLQGIIKKTKWEDCLDIIEKLVSYDTTYVILEPNQKTSATDIVPE